MYFKKKCSPVFDLGRSSSLSLECNSVAQFRCDLRGTHPEQALVWNLELELDSSLLWSPIEVRLGIRLDGSGRREGQV